MSQAKGIIKARLKRIFVYRFEFLITLILAPAGLAIFYFLWSTVYSNNGVDVIKGFTFQQLMAYYIVSWIVGILACANTENEITYGVRTGTIVRDMLAPIEYLWFIFYENIGSRIFAAIIEFIPVFIIGLIFFSLQLNPVYLLLFAASIALVFMINFFISALVGMTAFWIVQNRGIAKLRSILVYFLSGSMIPLTFFPFWFQKVSFFLPFQYLTFVPVNIWLGKYSIAETFQFLGIQLVWAAIFYALSMLVWRAAMKKVAAVGI
jgi:ABC-2 type transport system permease protein